MARCAGCSGGGGCECVLHVSDTDTVGLVLLGTGTTLDPWVLMADTIESIVTVTLNIFPEMGSPRTLQMNEEDHILLDSPTFSGGLIKTFGTPTWFNQAGVVLFFQDFIVIQIPDSADVLDLAMSIVIINDDGTQAGVLSGFFASPPHTPFAIFPSANLSLLVTAGTDITWTDPNLSIANPGKYGFLISYNVGWD